MASSSSVRSWTSLRNLSLRQFDRLPPSMGPRTTLKQSRSLHSTRPLRTSSKSAPFNYSIAASYIGKDRPFDPSTHVFHFNPYNRVQPPKKPRSKASRPDSGQDAFFVSRTPGGGVALGVADGVGGWMDSGVDPADFSHAFCDYMAAAAHEIDITASSAARGIMQKGYDAVCRDPSIRAGGSTAIVAVLDAQKGDIEVANLGDSGFVHLRPNRVHAHSAAQTHAFNTPFQLSVIPQSMIRRMAAFGGAQLSDLPKDADVTRHDLSHGDVLVFASDGLWDNLFDQDVLRIVSGAMTKLGAWEKTEKGIQVTEDLNPFTTMEAGESGEKETASLQSVLATEIVAAAKAASQNSRLDGPFAKEVKKYYPHENWRGGKVDDICVIVVVVSEVKEERVKAKL